MPLVERPQPTVLLTQRAAQLRNHAGQVSFPGGRIEPADEGATPAALREAHEEIGLEQQLVSVVGFLPDHVVITRLSGHPGRRFRAPRLRAAHRLRGGGGHLRGAAGLRLRSGQPPMRMRRSGFTGEEVGFCDIPYGERNIWGATAGMLLTLYQLCIAEDPDERRRRRLTRCSS